MITRQGNPDRICVHHSAVTPGARNLEELKARAKSYNTTHSTRSWAAQIKTPGEFGYNYIEYHYLIARDGSILQVQDEKYVLYHAGDNFRGDESFNLHGVAVMLDGNYESEKPTDAQKEALAKYIASFEKKYKVNVIVRGHKQTSKSATACPGRNIGTHDVGWLKGVIARANEILKTPVKTELEIVKGQLVEAQKQVKLLEDLNTKANNKISDLERQISEIESVDNADLKRLISEILERVK